MKRLIFTLFIFSSLVGVAQPYAVGRTTITFQDPTRSNRSIPTEIYYPAGSAGNNVPVAVGQETKFPVLVFGHGFVMTWDAYENIWQNLVPQGFILAFPKTEGSFSPSHLEFGKDLAFLIEAITALDTVSASIFFGHVDSMNCVMGHSMGGGSAFLAATLSPKIKSIATLAAAETSTSAIQAASSISIPALVLAGANDCVTPPANHQLPMYQNLASTCKTYLSIIGGSHCQMAESNFYCNFGEASCTPAPAISRAQQHEIMFRYLIPWLKYQLKGDCQAASTFNSSITSDTDVTFQKNCVLCPASSIDERGQMNYAPTPNPFSESLYFKNLPTKSELVIFDSMGRKVMMQKASNTLHVNTHDWPAGMYYFQIVGANGEECHGKLIKI
jgi:pimeloyl-ACP methyl ester carboxylesterase